MCQLQRTVVGVEDAALVVLQPVAVQADGDRPKMGHRPLHLRLGEAFPGGESAGAIVGQAPNAETTKGGRPLRLRHGAALPLRPIRPAALQRQPAEVDIAEGGVGGARLALTAALAALPARTAAIDELLLAQIKSPLVIAKVGRLEGRCHRKGPTAGALVLVADRADQALGGPVEAGGRAKGTRWKAGGVEASKSGATGV